MPHNPIIVPPYQMAQFNQSLNAFYHSLTNKEPSTEKMLAASRYFLNCPYYFEPLGEGPDGLYDQFPLYRTDLFDCVTYLNTVLALTHSTSLEAFQQQLMQIRYTQGNVHYASRTDWFTDLDWLPNARQLGWIEDITPQFQDVNGRPLALMAETLIDKPHWFNVKTLRALHHLHAMNVTEANQLLEQLRREGQAFQAVRSQLTYLPTTSLLDAQGRENPFVFDQIPSACVVVFAAPNWNIRDKFKDFPQGYGTNLNVRHVGLVFRIENEMMLYHASFNSHKVISMPLAEYLHQNDQGGIIKGIHLEKIRLA